jgi:hypothetical protein
MPDETDQELADRLRKEWAEVPDSEPDPEKRKANEPLPHDPLACGIFEYLSCPACAEEIRKQQAVEKWKGTGLGIYRGV